MFYVDCDKNDDEMCDAKKCDDKNCDAKKCDSKKCDDSKVFTSDEMSVANDVKRKFSVPSLTSLVRFGWGETQIKKVGNFFQHKKKTFSENEIRSIFMII